MPTEVVSPSIGKIAIIVRAADSVSETSFFSDAQDAMQLGLIHTDKSRGIPKHKHLRFDRALTVTTEFLLIREGSCKVNLWGTETDETQSFILNQGDGILLLGGIHSIDALTDELLMLEIKQGPYAGSLDKVLLE